MKTSAVLPLAALLAIASARAQGPLTPPPGAPAPVMKSLDQIEARTPLNTLSGDATASHIITLPGSYYLTGNVIGEGGKAGIRIEATNVTLDLNGYLVEAVGGSTTGIVVNLDGGRVAIRNGNLRFWPQGGITSTASNNVTVEDVAITAIGGPAISIPGPCAVNRVQVKGAKGSGILVKGGTVRDCLVENVTPSATAGPLSGIRSEGGGVFSSTVVGVTNSGGGATHPATGIAASVVRDCIVEKVSTGAAHASGIFATVVGDSGSIIATGSAENCRVRGVSSSGLTTGLYYFGTVRGCSVENIASTTASGEPTGISAHSVHESTVKNVTGGGSWVNGITANSVFDCMVHTVVPTGTAQAIGISLDDGAGVGRGGVARGCQVLGARHYGVYAIAGASVSGCSVSGLPSAPATKNGFYSYGAGSVFDGNSATHCEIGFNSSGGNLFVRNVASDNGTNYNWSTNAVSVASQSSATNPFTNFGF